MRSLLPSLCVCLATLVALGADSTYAAPAPVFNPVNFFTGRTRSSGVLEDRAGQPTKEVRTTTSGQVVRGVLKLEQDLFIEGKPRQHRSWQLRRIDAHHYEGSANDIVGPIYGEAHGNHFQWSFTLALKPGQPLSHVRMTQHMYLQPDGETMVNRSTIRKFGILVAQVTEQFRREPAAGRRSR